MGDTLFGTVCINKLKTQYGVGTAGTVEYTGLYADATSGIPINTKVEVLIPDLWKPAGLADGTRFVGKTHKLKGFGGAPGKVRVTLFWDASVPVTQLLLRMLVSTSASASTVNTAAVVSSSADIVSSEWRPVPAASATVGSGCVKAWIPCCEGVYMTIGELTIHFLSNPHVPRAPRRPKLPIIIPDTPVIDHVPDLPIGSDEVSHTPLHPELVARPRKRAAGPVGSTSAAAKPARKPRRKKARTAAPAVATTPRTPRRKKTPTEPNE
jgi:hypothetical protein